MSKQPITVKEKVIYKLHLHEAEPSDVNKMVKLKTKAKIETKPSKTKIKTTSVNTKTSKWQDQDQDRTEKFNVDLAKMKCCLLLPSLPPF